MSATGARLRCVIVALTAGLLVTGGCTWRGSRDLPLPMTKGSGSGSYTLTTQIDDVANLVPNAEVRLDDVVVGSVRSISFDHWRAKVVLGLERGTQVPANVQVKVGQKSLLGAEYVELDVPAAPGPALAPGSTIATGQTGNHPETEDVLSAMSLLLNGGGLQQLRTITTELNKALDGREVDVRSLITRMNDFLGSLNSQRGRLVDTLRQMNRLSGVLAHQNSTVTKALDAIPWGERVLLRERSTLMKTLRAASRMSAVTTQVLDRSRDSLAANLRDLTPALRKLADAGRELPMSLGFITLPIALDPVHNLIRGDYINIFLNLDLTSTSLTKAWTTGGFAGLSTTSSASANGKSSGKALTDLPSDLPSDLLSQLLPPLSGGASGPATKGSKGLGSLLDLLLGGARR